MADKERKQVNINITPDEWVMFRQVAIAERKSVAVIIREHFYALAAKHGIERPSKQD